MSSFFYAIEAMFSRIFSFGQSRSDVHEDEPVEDRMVKDVLAGRQVYN